MTQKTLTNFSLYSLIIGLMTGVLVFSTEAYANNDRFFIESIGLHSVEAADIAANDAVIEREIKRGAERIARTQRQQQQQDEKRLQQQQQQQNRAANRQDSPNRSNVIQRYDTNKTYLDRIPQPERLFNNIR